MKINAAIIGMGIGWKHFEAIEELNNCTVKIICEKDPKKIKYLLKKFPNKIITSNENKIFKDKSINLVSIASYDNYHYNQIIKCIKYKKHIIVEKPMCLNLKHLKNIRKLINKNKNIKISSNLVLRVNSLFQHFKKNVNKKSLFYLEADYNWGRKYKLFGWRSKIKDYSIISGAAIHMIDLINWMTSLKPKSVYAIGTKKPTINSNFKKQSMVVILLKFSNGIIAKIAVNGAGIYKHFHEVKIFSNEKTLVNSRLGSFVQDRKKISKLSFSYPDKKNRKKFIKNFIKSISNNKIKPPITLKEQIDLMTICFAADTSAALNKKIKINYL